MLFRDEIEDLFDSFYMPIVLMYWILEPSFEFINEMCPLLRFGIPGYSTEIMFCLNNKYTLG